MTPFHFHQICLGDDDDDDDSDDDSGDDNDNDDDNDDDGDGNGKLFHCPLPFPSSVAPLHFLGTTRSKNSMHLTKS